VVYAFKRDQVPLGPDLYYANVASALSLIKTSLYLVITVIFDAFIVSSRLLCFAFLRRFLNPRGSFTDASSFGTATSS
jgi:hypothetical protein